jgi:hypothetical protein
LDIKRFKYKYKSARSAKTPRYRFVKQQEKVSTLNSKEEDIAEESTENCHSPMSSNASSSGNDVGVFEEEPSVTRDPAANCVDSNFNFGFDPERDASLVASKFMEQFSGDKVRFLKVTAFYP